MFNVKIKTSDGEIIEVNAETLKASSKLMKVIIQTRLARLNMNDVKTDDDKEDVIVIPWIKSITLKKLIEWETFHDDNPHSPGNYDPIANSTEKWDSEFLEVDKNILFELASAASYLDIKPLLDITAKKVAKMIKGKSVEEIRTTFNIKNDFTEQEKKLLHEETQFVEIMKNANKRKKDQNQQFQNKKRKT